MNLTSLDTLEQRVNRGAQLLDLLRPNWATEIDLERIEVPCPVHSIAGQLFGPDVDEQMIAVGILPVSERPWGQAEAFAESGFCVLVAEAVAIPDSIRDRIHAVISDLSAMIGRDMNRVMEVPPVLPYPRDRDVVTQEAFTLELLWQKAVISRL